MFRKIFLSRENIIVSLLIIATSILAFYGNFNIIPSLGKIIYAVLIWSTVLFFPYKNFYAKNNIPKILKYLVVTLLLLGIFQTIRSFIFIDEIVSMGNNYLTLFGNNQHAMIFIPPLFFFMSLSIKNFRLLIKYHYFFFIIIILSTITTNSHPVVFVTFSLPLFYYLRRKIEFFALLIIIVLSFFAFNDGIRSQVLYLGAALMSLLVPRLIKNRNTFNIVIIAILLLPYFSILWNLIYQISPFEVILSYISDDNLSVDTRTFLYEEVINDLLKSNTIMFGKGALSGYTSDWFLTGLDNMGRNSVEVYFLLFLLRSGLLYLIIINLVIIFAIYNTLKNSNNKLTKSIATFLAMFLTIAYISDLNGCSLQHFITWIFIAVACSNRIQKLNDKQIIYILYNTKKIDKNISEKLN